MLYNVMERERERDESEWMIDDGEREMERG
jgi:hypothetical protein